MGIGRFYRWLSERYPFINEKINIDSIPEFDRLYLDMNGIVHNCSHANNPDVSCDNENDIWTAIFQYINRLVWIIKPKELLYLAVDGVAPRAKMNQQRTRRFRAQNDAREKQEEEERMDPSAADRARFNSNCITPGTRFMKVLCEQLSYFIYYKQSTDKVWRDLKVVLSTSEVPGEGEHKIIDFIRSEKSQHGYNPNTRHCLYGLDADLIMLALVSHEPHFALLREKVVFGRRRTETIESRELKTNEKFQLLHISLLREYLDLEFCPTQKVETNTSYMHDAERVIDDFILFCFLVGNDFLPHLPFSNIIQGGLEVIMRTYKQHLTEDALEGINDPWLTRNCGEVNWNNFKRFLTKWVVYEEEELEECLADEEYLTSKRANITRCGPDDVLAAEEEKYNKEIIERQKRQEDCDDLSDNEIDDFDICYDDAAMGGHEARDRYYLLKLNIKLREASGRKLKSRLLKCYLEGLQWVLFYYYRGVCSWEWFYPFHYAPFVHDILLLSSFSKEGPNIEFELGKPFQPFQQLMAVLPPGSSNLLPSSFQSLLHDENSPIKSFYPITFDIDMEGTNVPWGGITLIPFIDQKKLIDAMDDALIKNPLNDEESSRNTKGYPHVYTFCESCEVEVRSPIPSIFPDLKDVHVKKEIFHHKPIPTDNGFFINKLLQGVMTAKFPTLNVLKFDAKLEKGGVTVFNNESKEPSMILKFHRLCASKILKERLLNLLNSEIVYVDYPFQHIAKVVMIETTDWTFQKTNESISVEKNDYEDEHCREVERLVALLRKFGGSFTSNTLEPGQECICVEEALLELSNNNRKCKLKSPSIRKKPRRLFENNEEQDHSLVLIDEVLVRVNMLQSITKDRHGKIVNNYKRDDEWRLLPLVRPFKPDNYSKCPTTFFKDKTPVLCLEESELFGLSGIVVQNDELKENKINVKFLKKDIFMAKHASKIQEDLDKMLNIIKDEWFSVPSVCEELRISQNSLFHLFGSIYFTGEMSSEREDLGMNLKVNAKMDPSMTGKPQGLCLPGYSKMTSKKYTYEFSRLAVDAAKEYLNKWPCIRNVFNNGVEETKRLTAKVLWPNDENAGWWFQKLVSWVNQQDWKQLKLVSAKHTCMTVNRINEVKQIVDKYTHLSENNNDLDKISFIDPIKLIELNHQVTPNLPQKYINIGQRVICVDQKSAAAAGSMGTVTGIYHIRQSQANSICFEVLMDNTTLGSDKVTSRCPSLRSIQCSLHSIYPIFNTINRSHHQAKIEKNKNLCFTESFGEGRQYHDHQYGQFNNRVNWGDSVNSGESPRYERKLNEIPPIRIGQPCRFSQQWSSKYSHEQDYESQFNCKKDSDYVHFKYNHQAHWVNHQNYYQSSNPMIFNNNKGENQTSNSRNQLNKDAPPFIPQGHRNAHEQTDHHTLNISLVLPADRHTHSSNISVLPEANNSKTCNGIQDRPPEIYYREKPKPNKILEQLDKKPATRQSQITPKTDTLSPNTFHDDRQPKHADMAKTTYDKNQGNDQSIKNTNKKNINSKDPNLLKNETQPRVNKEATENLKNILFSHVKKNENITLKNQGSRTAVDALCKLVPNGSISIGNTLVQDRKK
eukprot:GHVL01024268.1.p1 GENE.GHVL01024268.1~~GHVL01024268.1.p1  ORF type:complete len:1581 (+),score=236.97 GHVL01024268.1:171-4913(+)